MDTREIIDRYNKCMGCVCWPDKNCRDCEFNLPDDVWDACGTIIEYAGGE